MQTLSEQEMGHARCSRAKQQHRNAHKDRAVQTSTRRQVRLRVAAKSYIRPPRSVGQPVATTRTGQPVWRNGSLIRGAVTKRRTTTETEGPPFISRSVYTRTNQLSGNVFE
ncbi:hypothetical protein MRX96_054692 [Rhipicephalus microplus]